MNKKFKYGTPLSREALPEGPRRLPQYDECLREFLRSGSEAWKVNLDELPSKDVRVILSSLKWRVNNKEEFKDKKIRVLMRDNQVYLEREKTIV
jgi:hypothetical protein